MKNNAQAFAHKREEAPHSLFRIRPLSAMDIQKADKLYKSVSINKSNYEGRLNPESPNCFDRVGGMFEIQTAEKIERLLCDENEIFLVAETSESNLCALAWISLKANDCSVFEGFERSIEISFYENILCECRDSRLVYGGEIIVSPENNTPGLSLCMMYTVMKSLLVRGFTSTCGEVYRVCSYDYGTGAQKCDLFNKKSYTMLMKTGGIPIGVNPKKIIKLPGLTIETEPVVIYWRTQETVKKLKAVLEKSGIEIDEIVSDVF